MDKKIIFSIIAIIVILVIVFLSQQPYAQGAIKNIISLIEKYSGASLLGGVNNLGNTNTDNNKSSTDTAANNTTNNTLNTDAYTTASNASRQLIDNTTNPPSIGSYVIKGVEAVSELPKKVGGVIQNGGEAIKNEIDSGVQIISDTKKNIENYFSGITESILHPGENNNKSCPTTPTN